MEASTNNNTPRVQIQSPPERSSPRREGETQEQVVEEVPSPRPLTETEQLHEEQLSEPHIAKAKFLPAKQIAFDRNVVQKLMILSPHTTKEQVRAYNDEDKLELFKKFCRRSELRPDNYSHLITMSKLDENMKIIKMVLKFTLTSASFLNLLSRKLLKSTRCVQSFCKRSLMRHRATKGRLLDQWKEVESQARRKIRTEVEYWAKRTKSATSQRSIEEMWEVYMKCWVSKEEMVAAIHSCWVERRNSYVKRFREWGKREKANLTHGSFDTMTAKRQREQRALMAYPPLKWQVHQVTIAELVAHHELLSQRKIGHSINEAAVAMGKAPRNFPTEVGDITKLESPVSYYHALLQFDRKKMYLMIFLHQLQTSGFLKLPPGPSPSVREQATQARNIHARWEAKGVTATQLTKTGKDSKRRGRVIGPDGQPIGTLQILREESEANPSHKAPVARIKSPSPSTMAERRSTMQGFHPDGTTVIPPMSDFGYSQGPFHVSPSRQGGRTSSTPSLQGAHHTSGGNTNVAFGRGESPQPRSPSRAGRGSPPRLTHTPVPPFPPPAMPSTATKRRYSVELSFKRSEMGHFHIDLDEAEQRWKYDAGRKMLRRPQSARQHAEAVTKGSALITEVFSDRKKLTTATSRVVQARKQTISPHRSRLNTSVFGGSIREEKPVVETADKATSSTTLYDSAAENFYRTNVLGLGKDEEEAERRRRREEVEKRKKGTDVEAWEHVRADPDKDKKQKAAEEQQKRIASLRPTIARRAMANLRPVAPAAGVGSKAATKPRRMSWETRPVAAAPSTGKPALRQAEEQLHSLGTAPRPFEEPVLVSRPLTANLDHRWSKLQ